MLDLKWEMSNCLVIYNKMRPTKTNTIIPRIIKFLINLSSFMRSTQDLVSLCPSITHFKKNDFKKFLFLLD